jgi:glutamine amidotransferase
MQLLFESSCEGVTSDQPMDTAGLGLLKGTVRYLTRAPGLKIPHTGWNQAAFEAASPLSSGVSYYYFVHSLVVDCADSSDVVATTVHGEVFPSAVRQNNVWGVQFHPEKSGQAGLSILERFARC